MKGHINQFMPSARDNVRNGAPGEGRRSMDAATSVWNTRRQPLLAVLLGLLLLLAASQNEDFAQTIPAKLQKVDVTLDSDGATVIITGDGTLVPKLTILPSPPRVVIALPNTVVATTYNRVSAENRAIKGVRLGTTDEKPPLTRVVIDCSQACQYELLPGNQSKVVVKVRVTASSNPEISSTAGESKTTTSKPAKTAEMPPPATGAPASSSPEPLYAQKIVGPSKYTGPGGCAASSCHGSIQPRTITRISQNEYSIWFAQDSHARAFNALRNPVSVRMGRILNIGPPDQAPKCLVCHALFVAAEQRAQTFELDDGVSCESCHGPASAWLGPHTGRNWPHEKSLQLGMYDTRNLQKRAEKCLTCHLGTSEQFVNHEMIAAGHPDLPFELCLFSFYMPPHWKMPEQGDLWRQVQAWAVGQAVQLRESLRLLAQRANSSNPIWPEYTDLECFACHHKLTAPGDSWRQARGYPGRRPGSAPWNQSRVVVFRDLVDEISPQAGKQLDDEVVRLATLMDHGDRADIVKSATTAAAQADQLGKKIDAQTYDQSLTLRLLRRIARDNASIAEQGEKSAEQAVMTMDCLFRAYNQTAKPANATELQTAIDGLLTQLRQDPSGYSAPRFVAQMEKISAQLGR